MTLTPKDLSSIKKVVGDVFHEQISEYHANMVKPEFEKIDQRFEKIDQRFEKIDQRFDRLEAQVKDEINGLKGEFSQQVSKKEFNQLKSKVDIFLRAS